MRIRGRLLMAFGRSTLEMSTQKKHEILVSQIETDAILDALE